jgi:hypothetical protein
MLRLASLLTLLPVACLFGQSGTPVRVMIGDSASTDRYQIIRGADTTAAAGVPRLRGVGVASFVLSTRDTSTTTVLSDDPSRPVHVRVSAPQGPLTAVGALVIVHVVGDSVSIEARARRP